MKILSQTSTIIRFSSFGNADEGFLDVCEGQDLPFEIKRTFWLSKAELDVKRGKHAHYCTEMVLIPIKGKIAVNLEYINGRSENYILEKSNEGLYIPKLCWHEMEYSPDAIQLVMASAPYDESDYIRDYKVFKSIRSKYQDARL